MLHKAVGTKSCGESNESNTGLRLACGSIALMLLPAAIVQPAAGQCGVLTEVAASDAQVGADYGRSIAVEGGTAIVGAPLHNILQTPDAGKAYIYGRDEGGTDQWGQVIDLQADDFDDSTAAKFGFSVGISGDTAIVGAPEDDGEHANAGAAYIFRLNAGTGEWEQSIKLTEADPTVTNFGFSVAIHSGTAVVGANVQNRAYIFEQDAVDPDLWVQVAEMQKSGGPMDFGFSVAVYDDRAIVGAREDLFRGAVYVYERDALGVWQEECVLRPTGQGNLSACAQNRPPPCA